MDQITIKKPNPKGRLFLKIDLERDLAAGVYLSGMAWPGALADPCLLSVWNCERHTHQSNVYVKVKSLHKPDIPSRGKFYRRHFLHVSSILFAVRWVFTQKINKKVQHHAYSVLF